MEQLVDFFPLILILLVFWLLVIRPASKRQKDLRALQSALGPGDQVMLSAGIHGVVRDIGEDRMHVEIADGVVVQVAKAAIASRVDTTTSRPDPSADPRQGDLPDTHGDL